MTPFYERGGVTIYHGEALAVMAELPDALVDGLITDPPYSSGGMFRSDRTDQTTSEKYVHSGQFLRRPDFSGDNRDQRGYAYWSALWLSEALRLVAPGSPACVFTDWRQLPITTDALQSGGWIWRGIVPWDKTEAARPQKGRFRAQCEYVVWGTSGVVEDVAVDAPCLPGFFRSVVRQADKFHIAGKPVAVMNQVVRIVRPGGLILDPFMGSGTTLVAALQGGYRAIGIDRDESWCEIAAKRLQQDVLPLFGERPA